MTMATRFISADGRKFQVEEVVQVDRQLWVHYNDIETGKTHACLLEAFSEQFQPMEQ
jgi:hypothetical protein